GPFDRTAPATHRPETTPPPTAAATDVRLVAARAATAAVTKTATVVSSRFPTITHETTGTAIHSAIGSHASRASSPSPSLRSGVCDARRSPFDGLRASGGLTG